MTGGHRRRAFIKPRASVGDVFLPASRKYYLKVVYERGQEKHDSDQYRQSIYQ